MSARLGSAQDFEAAVERLCREWPSLPVAVVLVDIEAYDRLVARHGPDRALDCMGLVGPMVFESLPPPAAIAFHLGGPRFGVLLPCADEPAARAVADRIRETVASQVSFFDGRVVRLTATTTIRVRVPGKPFDLAEFHATEGAP